MTAPGRPRANSCLSAAAPWGMLAGHVTLSPVKADPFFGHCEVAAADLEQLPRLPGTRRTGPGDRRAGDRQRRQCRRLHRQARPPRNQPSPQARRQHPPHRALRARICEVGGVPQARGLTAIRRRHFSRWSASTTSTGDWNLCAPNKRRRDRITAANSTRDRILLRWRGFRTFWVPTIGDPLHAARR